jgi:hypothetical protein
MSRVCCAFVIALHPEAIASEKRAGSVTYVLRFHISIFDVSASNLVTKTLNRNFYVTALSGRCWREDAMRQSVVRYVLLIFALVATGVVSGATNQRQVQVGGFTAQLQSETAGQPAQPTQTQTPGHRHLLMDIGVPITSRLEPEDKVVEVIDNIRPFVGFQNTDAEEELEIPLDVAPAVAIIDVVGKESTFTSGEDWITSTLTVQVRDVLKDSTGQLVAGNLVEVTENSGEVVLPDGRRIIARRSYNRSLRVGGTYLAAFSFYKDRLVFDSLFSVEFDNGKVKRMRLGTPPDTGLEQKTPEWTTQRARAIAERRPR